MKAKLVIPLVLLALAACWLFVTGGERTDVFINEYSLSEDGRALVLNVGVASSAGYTRSVKSKSEGDGLYLTFYSAFGINLGLGARSDFAVALPEGCEAVYIKRSDGFRQALTLTDGQWERVKN